MQHTRVKMVVCCSMRQLSLAHLLLLAPPTNSYSTNSVRSLVDNFRGLYEKLESADIYHPLSPTIRFSFVPPNDDSINENFIPPVSSAGDSAVFMHVTSRYGNEKPLAVYLPGLDGFGISATQQYDELAGKFELWRMTISTTDRSSFQQLVSSVADFIQSLDEHRPITLIGESFGGLLAPAVALRLQSFPGRIQGLVMVNPATSFDETQWSALGPFLASLRHVPGISNLPSAYSLVGGLALSALVPDRSQFQKIVSILLGVDVGSDGVNDILRATTEGFGILEERLPADVVQLRVGQWLPVGSAVVNPRLKSLNVPTLVIVGEDDSILPSKQEADRLVKEMPSCSKLVVRGAGHFVLDDRVNLTEAILYSAWDPLGLKKEEARYDPIVDWQLPPPDEVRGFIEQRVEPLRRLASPIFFSTCHQGKRWKGLSKLPSDGPILFVANHQLLGLDLGMIMAELLEERGIIARGLGHPVIFQSPSRTPGIRSSDSGLSSNDVFQKFGAVMVTPKNYYRLLQTGQNALLFPGGVREVFHGKDESYQLFWPEKVDFVRTAARHNATIIPISAVGAADSLNVLMDAQDVAKLPFGIGQRVMASSANIASARFNQDNEQELFTPPVVVPARPARHYFVFGKAMCTKELDHKDMDGCQELYHDVQKELQRGFKDVLAARAKDPYADPVRRLAYEQLLGKKAPTFAMSELNRL